MGLLRMEKWICPDDHHCSQSVANYLGSKRSAFSLALGLISVMSWGVAEVPQIVTNFKKKSSKGLSIWFLMTWILGDLLNLFGCLLEPGTLPTQYYTAMLYTVTTLILVSQVLYYGHVYPRMKATKMGQEATEAAVDGTGEDHYRCDAEKVVVKRCRFAPTSPIPFQPPSPSVSEELYFMSARSLSVSNTPIIGSFAAPRTPPSDLERNLFREPLLSEVLPEESAPPAQIKTMLCVVSVITFLICRSNHQLAETHKNVISRNPARGILLPLGRQLLEMKTSGGSTLEISADKSSNIGSILGWGMAAIYLGGRLPQICLNIRRGHAEGLNPLMFIFALVGNSTYVASILVNSTDWSKIQSNLPWLVDAGGCLFLDTFILIQFIYFRYRSRNEAEKYVS